MKISYDIADEMLNLSSENIVFVKHSLLAAI